MKTLQEEAENHAKKVWGAYYDDKHPDIAITETQGEISIKDYIAGATSDYVKAEKIRFAINELHKLQSKLHGYTFDTGVIKQDVQLQIYELELQLKALENGR